MFKNKLLTKVDVQLNHRYISIHAIYSSNSWPTEYHTHYIVIHIGRTYGSYAYECKIVKLVHISKFSMNSADSNSRDVTSIYNNVKEVGDQKFYLLEVFWV